MSQRGSCSPLARSYLVGCRLVPDASRALGMHLRPAAINYQRERETSRGLFVWSTEIKLISPMDRLAREDDRRTRKCRKLRY